MESTNKHPVIIFGDHIAAYGVVRSLAPYQIPMYLVFENEKCLCARSRYVRGRLNLSPLDNQFVSKLIGWLDATRVAKAVAIVAGTDEYLDVLSKNIDVLADRIIPTYPDWAKVSLIREKKQTHDLAFEAGVPVPKTYLISSFDQLNFVFESGDLEFPVVLKAEDTKRLAREYHIHVLKCDSRDEVIRYYKTCGGFYGRLLLQEYIPGDDNQLFNVICVTNKDYQLAAYFTNKKVRTSAALSTCSLMVNCACEELFLLTKKLVNKINYYGYINPEFKYDERDGLLKLMEINGRVTMSNSHALRCGINLPMTMYQIATDEPVSLIPHSVNKYDNKRILWWYPVGDLFGIIGGRKGLVRSIRETMGRGYIIEPLNFKDPYPFLWQFISMAKNYLNRIKARVFKKTSQNRYSKNRNV